MTTELEPTAAAGAVKRKFRPGGVKGKKSKKNPHKKLKGVEKPPKNPNPSQRMKKLFKKRARDYNSDDSDEKEEEEAEDIQVNERGGEGMEPYEEEDDDDDDGDGGFGDDDSDDEENQRENSNLGITKFAEGCRAFRTAFLNIMKKHISDDSLGPIMSAHKKLVAEKLLEEETEHKAKGEAKKEKQLAGEKGHVIPASFLDTKEKLLISIATKGVVKLFNAVNKAQNPQKGLNPSRSKDAKELAKLRKQTFLSELKKPTTQTPNNVSTFDSKVTRPANKANDDEPGWAPLRDNYMVSTKLKDWDRMPDQAATDQATMHSESSSDED